MNRRDIVVRYSQIISMLEARIRRLEEEISGIRGDIAKYENIICKAEEREVRCQS